MENQEMPMKMNADVRQRLHRFMLVALGGRLIAVDGEMNALESSAFCRHFSIAKDEQTRIIHLLKEAAMDTAEISHYVRRIVGLYPEDSEHYRQIMASLFELALADGALNAQELKFLKQVAELFGLRASDYLADVRRSVMPSHGNPYKVLGVGRFSSEAEIRSAYRQSLSEYHPDKFYALDWARDIAVIATARNAQISQAYHAIYN